MTLILLIVSSVSFVLNSTLIKAATIPSAASGVIFVRVLVTAECRQLLTNAGSDIIQLFTINPFVLISELVKVLAEVTDTYLLKAIKFLTSIS